MKSTEEERNEFNNRDLIDHITRDQKTMFRDVKIKTKGLKSNGRKILVGKDGTVI